MNTYADYLATMTVKALQSIAKDMGLKGYSKFRKAALISVIERHIATAESEAYTMEMQALVESMIEVRAAGFVAPVKSVPVAVNIVTAEQIRGWHVIANDMNRAQYNDARSLNLVTGGSDSERSDTYGINMRPTQSTPKVAFSDAPTATPTETENAAQDAAEVPSLDDLKDAYRNMRATVNKMGARGNEGQRRIRYVGKLRTLSAQLASYGVKAAFL